MSEPDKGKEGKTDESAAAAAPALGVLVIDSTPPGAEINIDGKFLGNAPARLKLSSGKHTVKLTAGGHQDWIREIEVMAESEVSLNVKMIEAQQDP